MEPREANWRQRQPERTVGGPASPSTPNNVFTPAAKSMGATWTMLERALHMLHIAAETFPLLSLVVNDLALCLPIFEAAAKGSQDCGNLPTELLCLIGPIIQHLLSHSSRVTTDDISTLSEVIRKEMEPVISRQSHSDEGLVRRYRRIKLQFQVMKSELDDEPEFVLPDLTTNNVRFCRRHRIDDPATEFSTSQFHYPAQKELYMCQRSQVFCLGLTISGAGQLVVVKGIQAVQDDVQQEEKDRHKRVRNELLIWRLLNPHPNIVSFLGITSLEDMYQGCLRPLAVSHYHERGTPRKFIRENRLNSRDRLKLLIGIVEGVLHIHQQSIVHGDLKGDNVVVEISEHEPRLVPKVIDFGSSRLRCSGCKYQYNHGQTGTFQWMSPEARGKNPCWTTQSDIWAVGCVALEVQLDTFPYTPRGEEPNLINAFHKQRRKELPAIRAHFKLLSWDKVAKEVWDIIETCWRLNPDERPTAEELLTSLRRAEVLPDNSFEND